MDTPGVSIEGTGQVGTYFYTAPEIEQGWPKIDEKVDAPLDSFFLPFALCCSMSAILIPTYTFSMICDMLFAYPKIIFGCLGNRRLICTA